MLIDLAIPWILNNIHGFIIVCNEQNKEIKRKEKNWIERNEIKVKVSNTNEKKVMCACSFITDLMKEKEKNPPRTFTMSHNIIWSKWNSSVCAPKVFVYICKM